MIYLVLL